MLVDDFLPVYDFRNHHEVEIDAAVKKVYQSLKSADLSESSVIRWLFWLRGLPSEGLSLGESGKFGFAVLGERENEELLLGIAGKFWTPDGYLKEIDSSNFREFENDGYAKSAANFSLTEIGEEQTRLSTETRIQTFGSARNYFGIYWALIGPFSGWIREEMLKVVKRHSESPASDPS